MKHDPPDAIVATPLPMRKGHSEIDARLHELSARADVESSPETFRAYRKRTMEGGSKMTEHNCPAPGCVTRVPREQLACRPHWYSIPKPLRDELWAAWDSGAGAGTSRHTTAVAACVEFLAKAA